MKYIKRFETYGDTLRYKENDYIIINSDNNNNDIDNNNNNN